MTRGPCYSGRGPSYGHT